MSFLHQVNTQPNKDVWLITYIFKEEDMTRISTNIASLTAVGALNNSSRSLNRSLERLSTGFRINRASDGPAALVISERLRSQVSRLKQAVDNTERAQNMINTAEGALVEMTSLLQSVQSLVLEAQNDGALSEEEILANQAQVDDAIQTIDRIANTTNFAGLDMLNGQAGYRTSNVNTGVTGTGIIELDIHGASITNGTSQIRVDVNITQGASAASVVSTGAIAISGSTLLVTGNLGAQILNFASGTSMTDVATAINTVTNSTGVTASAQGAAVTFMSSEQGSNQYVSIKDIGSPLVSSQFISSYDEGRDIGGTINGVTAASTGNTLSINTFDLDVEMTMSASFFDDNNGAAFSSAQTTFFVTGGGIAFQLGAGARESEQVFIGIDRIGSDNLGGHGAGGFLSEIVTGGDFTLLSDPETASKILGKSMDDLASIRAKLGAFVSNTLESNVNSLNVNIQNIQAAESRIRDTDFASETAEFTRLQILVQAGTAVVAQANLLPQTVLSLLA
jgi:flagellin